MMERSGCFALIEEPETLMTMLRAFLARGADETRGSDSGADDRTITR